MGCEMSVRKGEITDKIIDREYPYQVVMIWPEGGAGLLYDGMNATAKGLGDCRKRGLGSLAPGREVDGTRWCFEAEHHARVFQAVFGGDFYQIDPPVRPGGRYVPRLCKQQNAGP